MFRYLKAAFWVRQKIPLLGDVPINLIALPIIGALSFLHPAFLLIGLGFEATLVWVLASNKKFRELVDVPDDQAIEESKVAKKQELLSKLIDDDKQRFAYLEKRVEKVKETYKEFETPSYLSEPNERNLESLLWTYLKLLFAKEALEGREGEQNAYKVKMEIETLTEELNSGHMSHSVRKSKQATLEILQKRVAHFNKKTEAIAEIEADLMRIEAQVDLAYDNSRLQAKPDAISMDLELASDTMQSVWYYGDADEAIHSLDQQFESGVIANPITD